MNDPGGLLVKPGRFPPARWMKYPGWNRFLSAMAEMSHPSGAIKKISESCDMDQAGQHIVKVFPVSVAIASQRATSRFEEETTEFK